MSTSLTNANRIANTLVPHAPLLDRLALRAQAVKDVRDPIPKKLIDDLTLLSYYHLNTGKEVIDNI